MINFNKILILSFLYLPVAFLFPVHAQESISNPLKNLTDENAEVRASAAKELGDIPAQGRGPEVVPALIKALADTAENVRISAAYSLGKIGPAAVAAGPELMSRLSSRTFVYPALYALGEIRYGPAIPAILQILIGPVDADLRNAAHTAIRSFGERAVPELIIVLGNDKWLVKVAACDMLATMGAEAKEAVPSLIVALKDADTSVRSSAANALGSIGPEAKEAVPALIATLKDVYASGRAAWALGKIGPEAKEAVPFLREIANADIRGAPEEAALAVQRITGVRDTSLDAKWTPVQLGIKVNRSRREKNVAGLALGLWSTRSGDVYGFQGALGHSRAKTLYGLQSAIFLNNVAYSYGLQLGGQNNAFYQSYGIQIGFLPFPTGTHHILLPISNITKKNYGIQISPFINMADNFGGIQIGGVNSGKHAIQVAWLGNYGGGIAFQAAPVNISSYKLTGAQAGAANISGHITGIQIGLFNKSRGNLLGAQLGLINICYGNLKGIQIGLVNAGGANAVLPLTTGINFGF